MIPTASHAELARKLKPTAAFDTYWRFAAERQRMFMSRVHGSKPPWTSDPVLSAFRFTNPYRASDRVSQYLIGNVIYRGRQSIDEIFLRVLLFKIFNRVDTWELLESEFGEISVKSFDVKRYSSALDRAMRDGRQIYSAAYIMPSPAFGAERKHTNHLRLIARMLREKVPCSLERAKSLQQVFEILRAQPSFGNFLAFQFAIDLNYSELVNFSEMDFVVAGPGAKNGIAKCFAGAALVEDTEIIRYVTERAELEFSDRGLEFQSLWGRPLQLIDCQNLFCEVDKYSRVKHPDLVGASGRKKIKQRYRATSQPTPQWYPPKWNLAVGKRPQWSRATHPSNAVGQMSLLKN
jgi:5-hmdU DNA kinase-like protein